MLESFRRLFEREPKFTYDPNFRSANGSWERRADGTVVFGPDAVRFVVAQAQALGPDAQSPNGLSLHDLQEHFPQALRDISASPEERNS